MKPLKAAVLGVGALGQHHARILNSFDDVELIAVVDPRESVGTAVAAKHSTTWYAAADDIPVRPDAVVVAAPTAFHKDAALPLLVSGIPTLIEKPLAATLEEAEELANAAAHTGTLLQVGHVERFNATWQALQAAVIQPSYIRTQRLSPYAFRSMDIGVILDLMIHDIDLVLHLVGSTVVGVDSFGATAIGPHEDMATARLKFASGCVADLTVSRVHPEPERSIQVWDCEGFVHADLHAGTLSRWSPSDAVRAMPAMLSRAIASAGNPMDLKPQVFGAWIDQQTVNVPPQDALTAELRQFVDCIRSDSQPDVGGHEAVQALRIADEVMRDLSPLNWLKSPSTGQNERSRAA